MKKTIFIISLVLFLSHTISAQNKKLHRIRAYKVAFLSDRLDLTTSEAEKFWPIYNDYSKKIHSYRRNGELKLKIKAGIETLTEVEAKNLIQEVIIYDKKNYEAKKEFYTKLTHFLPYIKIIKLRVAEHEFKQILLKKLRAQKRKM